MTRLRGACVGAGYFSQFHYDAWSRMPEVEIVALCDLDEAKALSTCQRFGIPKHYVDFREMLDIERPDFVDIITPPSTHVELVRMSAERRIPIVCQKPLAPSLDEARRMVQFCADSDVRFMVHENFRFQPWHREIKSLLDQQIIGSKLHSLTFRSRPGDGWGPDAYLNRQPYFQTMPKLLVFETGVHFIDTFQYLAGDVVRVQAILRKLNPVIAGEDCGLLIFEFRNGAIGLWDANRYNESNHQDPRYTFGEFLVEGDGGTIRLAADGSLTVQLLGRPERPHEYVHERRGFAGDCVFATQRHFVRCLLDSLPFETDAQSYLKVLEIQDALYRSSESKLPVGIQHPS